MQPFSTLSAEAKGAIRYVLFDIDDTLTTRGKLTAPAYAALWDLHAAGYTLVPVTGRPAGWCDAIVRQWPVQAVIGENGAFAYYEAEGQIRRFEHPAVATGGYRARLDHIRDAVLAQVPGSRVAKDQFCRIYDLAIDFNEDPPHLGLDAARHIQALCEQMGARAKVSSIHVNAWFGDYDKVSMAQLFFREVWGVARPEGCTLFLGDSPNDEPMFRQFPYSCGVANIRPFAASMRYLPAYIAQGESGAGFAEIAGQLLGDRR